MVPPSTVSLGDRQMLAKLIEPETIEGKFGRWYFERPDGLYMKPFEELEHYARVEYLIGADTLGTEEYRTLHWTPADETLPALPFPFAAQQLAAFVLFGQGADIEDRWSAEDINERIANEGQKVHPAFLLMRYAHDWLVKAEERFPAPLVNNRKVLDWKTVDQQALWLLNEAQHTTVATRPTTDAMPERRIVADEMRSARRHVLKRRGDNLTAVLAKAAKEALDPSNWQSVWAVLVSLAEPPSRPPPLLGYTEEDGVKYQTYNEQEPVRWLSREAFRKRWERSL